MSLQSNQELLSNPLHRTFIDTCKNGDLLTIEYMLTSKTFVEKSFIFLQDNQELLDEALLEACYANKFEVCKFLLTSPKLNKHANVHTFNDMLIRMNGSNENSEFLEYLIMDFKINRTPSIDSFLTISSGKYASDLFYQRDVINKIENLKHELDNELNQTEEIKNKRLKV